MWLRRLTDSDGGIVAAVRTDWREIGGLGRVSLVGVVASLVVAVVLGFSITNAARDHLLQGRAHLLETVAEELSEIEPRPRDAGSNPAFDAAVRLRLLGGETVRVKLWLPDGTIAYSDSEELVGERFELSNAATSALAGSPSHRISNLAEPAHALERDLGRLIEFYIPYGSGAEPTAAFEVEQLTTSLDESLARISRNVWLSIGSGVLVLAVFLMSLVVARARDLNRRRIQAEGLLGALLHAQDEESRRIVGALHDDVGQPLYRLLYGIEGSRSRLDPGHPAHDELGRLADVVRDIDGTLRREMRLLSEETSAEAGLGRALADLAELTRRETDIEVTLDLTLEHEPDPVPRAALYRAAREGLMNVRRHADARRVSIKASSDGSVASVEISDDGGGGRIEPGLGITTTRERLEVIGGGLSVTTRRGRGTVFTAWVPIGGGGS